MYILPSMIFNGSFAFTVTLQLLYSYFLHLHLQLLYSLQFYTLHFYSLQFTVLHFTVFHLHLLYFYIYIYSYFTVTVNFTFSHFKGPAKIMPYSKLPYSQHTTMKSLVGQQVVCLIGGHALIVGAL